MSTEQPEALRLANAHEQVAKGIDFPELSLQTAAELRRLHEDCEDWKKGYALLFKENADRRRLNEELVEALRKARATLNERLDDLIESCTNPVTGLITDSADLLAIESDQDLINSIDATLAKAEAA
jgi:DNA anti-recombination protein RmuC